MFGLLLMLASVSGVSAQSEKTKPSKTEKSASAKTQEIGAVKDFLIDLEKKSWEAWKNRDGKFFAQFLSDDHVEVSTGGPTGKEPVVNFVGSPVCVVRSYSVDNFSMTMFDAETAVLVYHAAQDTTCGGNKVPSPVWVTSLFSRRDGRWQNILYQQSPANK